MALYIKNSANPVNSSLNFFATRVCPGKKGFIALYCSYNWNGQKKKKTGSTKDEAGSQNKNQKKQTQWNNLSNNNKTV